MVLIGCPKSSGPHRVVGASFNLLYVSSKYPPEIC